MPKLPVDFVKAPSFDNPLRSTEQKTALVERKLMLRLDEPTWTLLEALSEREGTTAEALVRRALDRFLAEQEQQGGMAARTNETRPVGLRAQIVGHLRDRVRRTWVHRLLSITITRLERQSQ